jgi:hypothetical protein
MAAEMETVVAMAKVKGVAMAVGVMAEAEMATWTQRI